MSLDTAIYAYQIEASKNLETPCVFSAGKIKIPQPKIKIAGANRSGGIKNIPPIFLY